MGQIEPSSATDVLGPTRLEDKDIYALVNRSWQFTKVLEWAIKAYVDLERHLAFIFEALRGAITVRDASEATCHDLETQLKDSKLIVFVAVKIQTKVEMAQAVAQREVSWLDILFGKVGYLGI